MESSGHIMSERPIRFEKEITFHWNFSAQQNLQEIS